jgi:hypothetical protein
MTFPPEAGAGAGEGAGGGGGGVEVALAAAAVHQINHQYLIVRNPNETFVKRDEW